MYIKNSLSNFVTSHVSLIFYTWRVHDLMNPLKQVDEPQGIFAAMNFGGHEHLNADDKWAFPTRGHSTHEWILIGAVDFNAR